MTTLAEQLGELLEAHGLMLATAESCTGGGVAQAITEVAGCSAWFDRGFITYTNLAKQQMLGVRENTLLQHGAVSEMTVREMVAGALANSVAQVALAVSGIAGPGGGTTEKPVGTVWFGWAVKDKPGVTQLHHLAGSRSEIRSQAAHIALLGTINILNKLTEET